MIFLEIDSTWLFIVLYFCHVFGLIAHPAVTILWAMEQFSIHILGTTPRASDSRIIMSFILNLIFVTVCYFVSKLGTKPLTVTAAVLAFVASHNLLGPLGIKKPMATVNERLRAKKEYSNIVFEGL
jgi:hypothetical protein